MFVLCLAMLAFGGRVFAQQPSAPEDALASWVEENLGKLPGKTLMVVPFPYIDGVKSVEGALISERVVAKLTEHGLARIVERDKLDAIMSEQKLSVSGLVEPGAGVRVGKLLGANGILTGSVTDLGEKIELHTRLLNVETAQIVATLEQTAQKEIKTFISPLWSEIDRIKKENKSFQVKFWADEPSNSTKTPSYRIGDFAMFHFQADRDCYVTIFDFTTSGSVRVLFPNSFASDNKIKAGRVYALPEAQAGFKIRVKEPAGVERLKLFATTKNVPLFQQDFSQEKFRSITSETYNVTRDLEAVVNSLEDNEWAEANLEARVEQVLRGGAK
jgi:hypothetical protein